MKKTIITVLAASLIAASVPAMAVEHGMSQKQMDEQCQRDCNMAIRNCGQESDTLQQKIGKLQEALGSGAGKYSREQISKLQYNLKDAQETLARIEQGGA